jgi:hypothetical protein
MKSIDLGCGLSKIEGTIGIDVKNLPGVDLVINLDSFPWPFKDSEVERVYTRHYLEHSNNIIQCIKEIHRIVVSNGLIDITVPHFASDNFHSDLTHLTPFSYRSFDHFSVNGSVSYNYYEDFKFQIVQREIRFMRSDASFNPFKIIGLHYFANKFPRLYERFFVYWIPPIELYFQLKVIK